MPLPCGGEAMQLLVGEENSFYPSERSSLAGADIQTN
jgi:hypothetical protein